MNPTFRSLIAKFHSDEEGLETLQVVMIIGIAAVILAIVRSQFPTIRGWFESMLGNITGWTDPTQ
jgi:hypothetical protein